MPDTWTVTPTSVVKNGAPIAGYVAHSLIVRHNTESAPFAETSLVVRVRDAPTEANRAAPIIVLTAAEQTMLEAEFAAHPAFTEFRSKPGDTIDFSGSVNAAAGVQPSQLGGVDVL